MEKALQVILATARPTRDQLWWLSLSGLSGDQLSGLSGDQLSWLSGYQLSGLSRAQLSWLSRDQLSGLSRDQLSWLSRDQLSGLSRDQLSGLSRDQLSWLSGYQLSGLSRDQLSGLSGYQLSWLSPAQLSGLSGDQKIPVVTKLYSRILSDLEAKARKLDQSTLGPDRPEEADICGTPMCIGGHTVNLAGNKGYKLSSQVGFALAALLIHSVSRPDVSAPRYDSYPSEWALAYIEQRASEEGA